MWLVRVRCLIDRASFERRDRCITWLAKRNNVWKFMARVKRSRGCPWKVYLRETNASRQIDGWKKSSDPLMETESRLGRKADFQRKFLCLSSDTSGVLLTSCLIKNVDTNG